MRKKLVAVSVSTLAATALMALSAAPTNAQPVGLENAAHTGGHALPAGAAINSDGILTFNGFDIGTFVSKDEKSLMASAGAGQSCSNTNCPCAKPK